MSVRSIRGGESVGAQRGEVVVCIAAGRRHEHVAASLSSVLEHAPPATPVLIYEAAGAGGGSGAAVVAAAAPADVVLLSAGCVVAAGWLAALRDGAYVDAGVATVAALRRGAVLAPGDAGDDWQFEEAAATVSEASLRIRPRVPAARGPCLFIRRSAIELVGGWHDEDAPAAPGADFSARCVEAGLLHLVADDVLVDDRLVSGPASAGDSARSGPVVRALGAARRALGGISVVIDARILSGPHDGTRVHVLELIAAVARTGRVRVTAIVPAGLDAGTRALLEGLPGVAVITLDSGGDRVPAVRGDIVHRPFQISSPADLTALAALGDRLVITHQDLISYHNPSYFSSSVGWAGYRDMTRRALAAADRVLFFSEHVRQDALAEDLVESHRASVVHIGVDHSFAHHQAPPSPPPGAERIRDDAEMILCLGTDFRHKNRIFALRMADELQRRYQWGGWLVLAGPAVALGSSLADERRMLAERPALAGAAVYLPAVSEAEKDWLWGRASLALYPTVHEGFGLIPFEAADHGVPCLWAQGTALSEVLPDSAAGIVAWDAAASADRAIELMRDDCARARILEAVRGAADALRWDRTAERLVDIYRSVCNQPATPTSALERTAGLMQEGLSQDAMRLVGPGGALAPDLERPLLALATHRRLATPVFGAIKAGYQLSQRWGGGSSGDAAGGRGR